MNKQHLIATLAVVLLAITTLSFTGCAALVIGGATAAGVGYAASDAETDLNVSRDQALAATDSALSNLGLLKIDQRELQTTGNRAPTTKIVARDPDDKKIVIRLAAIEPGATHISVRVGPVGNEIRAQAILDEINRTLAW